MTQTEKPILSNSQAVIVGAPDDGLPVTRPAELDAFLLHAVVEYFLMSSLTLIGVAPDQSQAKGMVVVFGAGMVVLYYLVWKGSETFRSAFFFWYSISFGITFCSLPGNIGIIVGPGDVPTRATSAMFAASTVVFGWRAWLLSRPNVVAYCKRINGEPGIPVIGTGRTMVVQVIIVSAVSAFIALVSSFLVLPAKSNYLGSAKTGVRMTPGRQGDPSGPTRAK